MNKLLEIQRDLRDIKDQKLKSKELFIRRIMESYNYDRINAEKVYEYLRYKRA